MILVVLLMRRVVGWCDTRRRPSLIAQPFASLYPSPVRDNSNTSHMMLRALIVE